MEKRRPWLRRLGGKPKTRRWTKKQTKGEDKEGRKKANLAQVVRQLCWPAAQLVDEGVKPARPFNSVQEERRRMLMKRRMLKKTGGQRKASEEDSQMLTEEAKEEEPNKETQMPQVAS